MFLLTGLKSNWKWPIGYWFVDKIKSPVQTQLIKLALLKCQEHNLNVISITCDGSHSNLSTFHLLGCDLYQPYDDIKCYFNDGQRIIYFTPDACHNIKLARNALGSFKAFLDENDDLIEWRYIEQLSKIQNNVGFKLANKLSSPHIYWRNNSMKVKLATQTLSSSVADALQFLQSISEEFKNCEATIKFIRIIDEIFDFLNSRNPFTKGYKKPIYPSDLVYLESRMRNNIAYILYSLKHTSGQPIWQSRSLLLLDLPQPLNQYFQCVRFYLIIILNMY